MCKDLEQSGRSEIRGRGKKRLTGILFVYPQRRGCLDIWVLSRSKGPSGTLLRIPGWEQTGWVPLYKHTHMYTHTHIHIHIHILVLSCTVMSDSWWSHDCSLPGFSVHGIFQARTLDWVAIPFCRGSSQARDWTQVACVSCTGRFFTTESSKQIISFAFAFSFCSILLGHAMWHERS